MEKAAFFEPLPESELGEIPNATSLIKAFNTFKYLKDKNKHYTKLEQLGQNCRIYIRNNTYNLKRKIGVLQYVGFHDTFFEFLGSIRNKQFKIKNN